MPSVYGRLIVIYSGILPKMYIQGLDITEVGIQVISSSLKVDIHPIENLDACAGYATLDFLSVYIPLLNLHMLESGMYD